jgi:hypothetical protein
MVSLVFVLSCVPSEERCSKSISTLGLVGQARFLSMHVGINKTRESGEARVDPGGCGKENNMSLDLEEPKVTQPNPD